MVKKVLLVLTSHDALGDTGTKTGSWLEELAAPYWTFVDAGHAVDLASIKGGAAPIDPASIGPPWLTPAGTRFQADPVASKKLAETLPLDALGDSEFDAVYLVGGAGAAYDFPESAALGRTVSLAFGRGKPVAAVCHGVLGLVHARDRNGTLLVANRRVTGVSNVEEATVQYDKVLPLLPENALKSSGGTYSAGEPFGAHVVHDGNLHTGQNPASAAPLAQALARELAGPAH